MLQPESAQPYTLAEYWKLIETFPEHRYEYIDNHVRMMTGGTPAHGQITGNIITFLNNTLRDEECNVYNPDVAVRLAENRYYYPDISVSCDPHDWTRTKAIEAPTVIIEVLSPGTEHIDRLEKLPVYKAYPTIQDILLVDARKRFVEHYHRVGPSSWMNHMLGPGDTITLGSLQVALPVDEIYRKVYLEMEDKLA
ncbi:MAG: Uma2 family endonuclease [Ktedonobacteraceae bacterium]|nr:Uma2 family endonuclease [Chloroflexota bacterium]